MFQVKPSPPSSLDRVNAPSLDTTVWLDQLREDLDPPKRSFTRKYFSEWFGDTVSPSAITLTEKLHDSLKAPALLGEAESDPWQGAARDNRIKDLLKDWVDSLKGKSLSRREVVLATVGFLKTDPHKDLALALLDSRQPSELREALQAQLRESKVGGIFGRFLVKRLANKLHAALVAQMVPVADQRRLEVAKAKEAEAAKAKEAEAARAKEAEAAKAREEAEARAREEAEAKAREAAEARAREEAEAKAKAAAEAARLERIHRVNNLRTQGQTLKAQVDALDPKARGEDLQPYIKLLQSLAETMEAEGDELKDLSGELYALAVKLKAGSERVDHLKSRVPLAPDTVRVLAEVSNLDFLGYSSALEHVLHIVPPADTDRTLALFNRIVFEKRGLEIITGIAQGNALDIDGLMSDASWDEAALALKAAVLKPGDEKAQRVLAVQHQLRIARRELNEFMRAKVEANPKLKRSLPVSVYGGTLPTESLGKILAAAKDVTTAESIRDTLAAVLGKSSKAPSVAEEMEFPLLEWGRLSLYDPETERVDTVRLQSFLKALRLEDRDAARAENYLRQGFRNMAEVNACSQRIVNFSKAIQKAKGVDELVAQGSQRFQAQEISRDLLAQVRRSQDPNRTIESVEDVMPSLMAAQADKKRALSSPGYKALMQERQAIAATLKEAIVRQQGASHHDLRWLDDPIEVRNQRQYWEKLESASKKLKLLENSKSDSAQASIHSRSLTGALQALRGFSVQTMRHYDKSESELTVNDLKKIEAYREQLQELFQKDEVLVRTEPAGHTLTKTQKELTKSALNIAILEEIASGEPQDFSPAKYKTKILEHLSRYGLGEGWSLMARHEAWKLVESKLDKDQRSAQEVLDKLKGKVRWEAARQAVCDTRAARDFVKGDPQREHQKVVRAIESAFKKIEPGQSCDISFGVAGALSVGVPVAVVASASLEAQVRRHTGLTVSCDSKGQYEIEIHQGNALTMGLSIEVVADLLSVGVEGSGSKGGGHVLAVSSRDQCEALVKALCTGDEGILDLLIDARVQASQRGGKGVAASATAQMDLTFAAAQASARASKDVQVERRRSAQGTVDIFSRTQQVKAEASVNLAADLGGASVESGANLTLVRTVHKQFGRLTDECGLTVSAQVFNGNLQRALRRVLPASEQSKLNSWVEKVKGTGQSADEVGEVFLTLALKPEVIRQANDKLAQAQWLVLNATGKPAVVEEFRARASALIKEADTLTRDWNSYRADGVGWASTESSEVTSRRIAYDYFASAQARSIQGFLAFEQPQPVPQGFGAIG